MTSSSPGGVPPSSVKRQWQWRIMLDAARAALNPADWFLRLSIPAYLDQGAAKARDTLRTLPDAAHGSAITDGQLVGFGGGDQRFLGPGGSIRIVGQHVD